MKMSGARPDVSKLALLNVNLLPLNKHRDVCPLMRIAIQYLLAFLLNKSSHVNDMGMFETKPIFNPGQALPNFSCDLNSIGSYDT